MIVHAEQLADPTAWRVWHCNECRYLFDVVWANDDTYQYGRIDPDRTVQAERIVIIPEARIVYINPPLDLRDLVIEEQEALCQS